MPLAKSPKLALLALTVGHFAVDIQSSGLALLIPLLRAQLGLDYAAAAAIVTTQTLTSSVIQPLFGMASDRHPMRALLPVSCLLAGMATVTALFMPSYGLVLAVVFITGLGSASYHAAGSLNANYVSGDNKASGMSVFFAGGQLGYSVGPLLMVTLLGVFGPRGALGSAAPSLLGAGVLLLSLPLYVTAGEWRARRERLRRAQPPTRAGRRRTAWGLTTIVAVICLRSVIQTSLITFIPLYFTALNPDNKEYAALLLSIFVFAGAVGTLFGGRLADRFDRKPVLAISLGIVLPLLVVFLRTGGLLQVLSLALAGASLISASSLTVVMAQELLPNNIGLASGLTLGLGFGAGGLGALVLGEVADAYGLATSMWIIAFLPALLVALTLLLPGRGQLQAAPAIPSPEAEATGR